MFKKLLLSILIFSLLATNFLSLFPSTAYAQDESTWYNQQPVEWFTKVYDDSTPDEIFGERYTAAQVEWIIYSLALWLPTKVLGTEAISCVLEGEEDIEDCIDLISGAILENSNLAYQTSKEPSPLKTILSPNRPLSGINYVASIAEKFNIATPVHAQGFGFGALSPVQKAWQAVRDVTYLLFILIIIIIAFMIMFRVKLSPQTVITVQSALPKIAITLILVTFSFAIAGFMVDLVYVVIGLLAWIVDTSGIFFVPGDWNYVFTALTKGPIPIVGLGAFGWIIVYIVLFFFGFFIAWFGAVGIVGIITSVITLGTLPLFVGIVGLILTLVVAIILFFAAFKIFFYLIKTYVNILILVIFAPFQIVFGALSPLVPGVGFGAWLRNLAANLAVYPLTGALFLLAFMFLGSAYDPLKGLIDTLFGTTSVTFGGNAWYPPLTVGEPSLGGNPLPLLMLAASLVIMLMIPKAGDLIKSLISGKPFDYGTAIGEAMGPVALAPQAGIGALQKIAQERGRESALWNAIYWATQGLGRRR